MEELGVCLSMPSALASPGSSDWLPCVPVSLKVPCTHLDPSPSPPGPDWRWEGMRMKMPGWGEAGGEVWLLHVGFVLVFLLRYLLIQVPR